MYLFILWIQLFGLHLCPATMCLPGACGGLKQVSDPLEQKLQTVVGSHSLCIFNCWAFSGVFWREELHDETSLKTNKKNGKIRSFLKDFQSSSRVTHHVPPMGSFTQCFRSRSLRKCVRVQVCVCEWICACVLACLLSFLEVSLVALLGSSDAQF